MTMKRNLQWRICAAMFGLTSLFLGLRSYGQDATVKYLGPLNPSVTWSGDYAGVYNGQVNGAAAQLICDDYQDSISSGQSWNATALNVSSLGTLTSAQLSNDTMFGKTVGFSGYAQVAYLVNQIFAYGGDGKNPTNITLLGVNHLTLADLSAVVWAITDPSLWGLSSRENALRNAVLSLYTDTTAAKAYLATLSDLWLYTPDPNRHGGGQEMWRELGVPEGGATLLYLLLTGLVVGGAFLFRARCVVRS